LSAGLAMKASRAGSNRIAAIKATMTRKMIIRQR
jgi:hypothetical protein